MCTFCFFNDLLDAILMALVFFIFLIYFNNMKNTNAVNLASNKEFRTKKFFKVMREDGIHNDYKYHDGLNKLKGQFNWWDSCCKGGLYFTDINNIHRFYSYGTILREIYLPFDNDDLKVVIDPSGNKWRANMIIIGNKHSLSDIETYKKFNIRIQPSHVYCRSTIDEKKKKHKKD